MVDAVFLVPPTLRLTFAPEITPPEEEETVPVMAPVGMGVGLGVGVGVGVGVGDGEDEVFVSAFSFSTFVAGFGEIGLKMVQT